MVFIEYDVGLVDGTRNYADVRFDRARAAHKLNNPDDPNAEYHLPPVMSDSTAVNKRYHEGLYSDNTPEAYYKKDLIDPELARGAQAEVNAAMWRVPNTKRMHFQVSVKNLSGKTLNSANGAAVTVVIYEDVTRIEGSTDTSRIARGGAQVILSTALANNATASYSLETAEMTRVQNWSKLHGVAFIDYRPGGATGAYDMLQGDVATLLSQPLTFAAAPDSLAFSIDVKKSSSASKTLTLSGSPSNMTWTVTKDSGADWLTVTPTSGTVGTQVTVKASRGDLNLGTYKTTLHFQGSTAYGNIADDIPITMSLMSSIKTLYIPYLCRK